MRLVTANTVVVLLFSAHAFAADPHSLVYTQRGNLPILLTSPHGGEQVVLGVPERTGGTRTRDTGALELTKAVAASIAKTTGSEPYVVAALFHRKYIDANRAEGEALENSKAEAAYRAYHARIREFTSQLRERFPQGAVLLDIHGQSTEPDSLVRGTQNGKTVARLLKARGETALTGPESILGALAAKGWLVDPSGTTLLEQRETPKYGGGFTVQTYGSHTADGIDAIQLEFGRDLRKRSGLADDVAAAIVGFGWKYLGMRKS